MIYVTGDTHMPLDAGKLKARFFPEQKEMTKKDYVIICGDFGGVWDNSKHDIYWQEWLQDKNFTTLFVDGNHENHKLLNSYDVVEWHGGHVHEIMPSVLHLMRGEIYNIDGNSIFTLGGAASHDIEYRTPGKDWWHEELPSMEELEYALRKLDKVGHKVDYIITHDCPESIQDKLKPWYGKDRLNYCLQKIEEETEFKHWYFGHYHVDKNVDAKHTCLYKNIIKI